MEPEQRAATVAEVSNKKRGELVRLAEVAGPPCTDCRFERRKLIPTARGSEWATYCGAPPAQNYRYDPVRGKMEVETPLTAAKARLPGGLCGIEAEMFRAKHPAIFIGRGIKDGARIIAYTVGGSLVTFGVLAALFGQ